MATHLIGVSGRKRSGKDTFAARLISDHGFTKVAFAEPMRAMLKAQDPIVDWIGDDVRIDPIHLTDVLGPDDDWETAKELPEVRRLLQDLGTEAGRAILGENVWVDAAFRVVDEIPGPVVITDVRFPNEADAVDHWSHYNGDRFGQVRTHGLLVRVTRPGLPEDDLHPSETALDDWSFPLRVQNNGTVSDLHEAADAIAHMLL